MRRLSIKLQPQIRYRCDACMNLILAAQTDKYSITKYPNSSTRVRHSSRSRRLITYKRLSLTYAIHSSPFDSPTRFDGGCDENHDPKVSVQSLLNMAKIMNLSSAAAEEESVQEVHVPADVNWEMLDKSKFFFLGAALFSGVSATLYPAVLLKTRQQVAQSQFSCIRIAFSMVRFEGFRSLYRGFGTSLMGTIPARALYMAALEVTKSHVGTATVRSGLPEPTAAAIANGVAGLSAAMAAQLVWTPVDVVSQRLMVQGGRNSVPNCRYVSGLDAFRKIIATDGPRGLYRGFGISILTHAPSNAAWWALYSVAQRLIWGGIGCCVCKKGEETLRPDAKTVMAVQGASAAMAGGVSALITMPLDTIKTRLQVLDGDENGRRAGPNIGQTFRNLVKEGGWLACYRGLGPRCASMSMSATTMITTYEFLKRLSTKNLEVLPP